MAVTVDTSTSVKATYGQRVTAVDSDGTDWVALYSLADTRIEFWYSTDDGATWTENTGLRLTVPGTFKSLSFFIDWEDVGVVAFCNDSASTSTVYWTEGDPISTGSWAIAQDVVPPNTFVPYAVDVVSFQLDASTRRIAWATVGPNVWVYWQDFFLSNDAPFGSYAGSRVDLTPNTTAEFITLDFEHTGDGVTATGGKSTFVTYRGSAETSFCKIASNGTRNTVRNFSTTAAAATDPLAGIFDGSRFVVAFIDDAADTTVQVYERDAADTTSTSRTPNALSDGAVTSISVTYNVDKDIILYAVGTTSDDVKRCVFDRSAGTWSAWGTVEATTATAGTMSVQRGYQGDGINVVWASGSGSPYTVTFERDPFNTAPNAPTWLTPADSSAQDETATLPVTWAFDDPDAGDTQSAYAIKRTISAVTTYYNAGAGTWSGTEVKNTSSTEGVTLPATWGANGDEVALYVKTWDAADTEGVYGDALNLTGSVKVNPTITVPADNATLSGPTMTVTWTATGDEVTAHRIRILTSADAVLYDTGKVTSTAMTTVLSGYTLANGLVDIKAELRTWNDEGLESSTDTATGIDVTYTPPATPVLTVTNVDASGYISVAIADPTPGGGEPTVVSHDVFVRVASGGTQVGERPVGGDGIRIATGVAEDGTYLDYAAASGVDFEYRTLAYGDSGAVVYSAWT